MRLPIAILPIAALGACVSPAPQAVTQTAAAAQFVVPMDPGSIRCQQLANPAALAAATDWAMGQARADLLSGKIATLPETATVSGRLTSFCNSNSGATLRNAAAQLG